MMTADYWRDEPEHHAAAAYTPRATEAKLAAIRDEHRRRQDAHAEWVEFMKKREPMRKRDLWFSVLCVTGIVGTFVGLVAVWARASK